MSLTLNTFHTIFYRFYRWIWASKSFMGSAECSKFIFLWCGKKCFIRRGRRCRSFFKVKSFFNSSFIVKLTDPAIANNLINRNTWNKFCNNLISIFYNFISHQLDLYIDQRKPLLNFLDFRLSFHNSPVSNYLLDFIKEFLIYFSLLLLES